MTSSVLRTGGLVVAVGTTAAAVAVAVAETISVDMGAELSAIAETGFWDDSHPGGTQRKKAWHHSRKY